MKIRMMIVIVTALAYLTGCGGGDEGSSSTGSDQQTRTRLSPEEAIQFVKNAITHAATMKQFDTYFRFFAPASTDATNTMSKDIGIGSCQLVTNDQACEGVIRIETDFPLNQAQASYKSGSTYSIQWDNIKGADLIDGVAINRKDVFTFLTDLPSIAPRSGQFTRNATIITPTAAQGEDEYVLDQLDVTVDSPSKSFIVNGNITINPNESSALTIVDLSENITFEQWFGIRASRQPGSSITMKSKLYLTPIPTVNTPSARVVITVITSDLSRTEYQVKASTSAIDVGTTRTVIGTLDSALKLQYTAS